MAYFGSLRITRSVIVSASLVAAAMSLGATEPAFPDLGRGDQLADLRSCVAETIDGVKVCAGPLSHRGDLSITTVAAGLTIVE